MYTYATCISTYTSLCGIQLLQMTSGGKGCKQHLFKTANLGGREKIKKTSY